MQKKISEAFLFLRVLYVSRDIDAEVFWNMQNSRNHQAIVYVVVDVVAVVVVELLLLVKKKNVSRPLNKP